jgi:hypothetical protein
MNVDYGKAVPRVLTLLLAVFMAAALSERGEAQVLYGSIVGNVRDSSGAAIPGATVTITNKETNLTRETLTSDTGAYTLTNVLPGTYSVKVTLTGFKEFSKTEVPVTVNTITRVDVMLEVGQLAETVTVAADAVRLQTDKADLHVDLNTKEITDLPLSNYRNYQTLINLVPGATPGRFQNANTDTPARALTTNVNGTNRNNNNTRIDGSTSVFLFLPHHTAYVAPAETIETVNISTNNFDAEQGMAGGAAITLVTKAGTNDLHGSAFAMHDNSAVRAKNFFLPAGIKKPNSIQNIDGFTLGGPIVKDKLFYFGGWEGTRERVARGFNTRFTLATEDQRRGDFSRYDTVIYDPLTGNPDGSDRTPFPNNIIPENRISPITRKMQDLVPLPNLPGVTNNYSRSATQAMNRDNFDVKLNWNRTTSHQVWAKFSMMDAQVTGEYALGPAGGGCLCDGGAGVGNTKVYVGTVGTTWTMGPKTIVDGTFGITRMDQTGIPPDLGQNFGLDVLGIPGTNGPDPKQSGLPAFNITSYASLGNTFNWMPAERNDRSYTGTVNFTRIQSAHEYRWGFDLVRHELNHWQPEQLGGPRGRFVFPGDITALRGGARSPNQFNAYAAFLLGLPASMDKSLQYELMTGREWQFAWYFRDRWQATRNLTLTFGLRYELYPLMHRADRGIELLDLSNMKVKLGDRGGNPEDLGIKTSKKLFAPRFGLAYRLGDSTVIRSGYGLTYNPMPFARPIRGFYPLVVAQNFVGPSAFVPFRPIAQGIPEFTGPDLNTGLVDLPPTVDMRTPYPDQIDRGYIQSWNLAFEHKFPLDLVVSTAYVGSQTTRSFADLELNAAGPGGGNSGRPFAPLFGRTGSTLQWDGWLSANYHALQVALNRTFTKGLFLKGAYTYSKAINWADDDGWTGLTFNHPSVLNRNRAQAGFNIPHMLQLGIVAELPFGKNGDGLAKQLIKGWQLNGIWSAIQGRPFNVTASGASLDAPGNTQTADQVGPITKLGGVGPGQPFYDPASFSPVTDVRFGNTGRNLLRGPGLANLDLSLFRKFPLTERLNLEFRAEAFNFTNTPHFNNPSADASNPSNFLIISSALTDERQFRFGLRLGF